MPTPGQRRSCSEVICLSGRQHPSPTPERHLAEGERQELVRAPHPQPEGVTQSCTSQATERLRIYHRRSILGETGHSPVQFVGAPPSNNCPHHPFMYSRTSSSKPIHTAASGSCPVHLRKSDLRQGRWPTHLTWNWNGVLHLRGLRVRQMLVTHTQT